ncbi:MAG: hypothetical protein QXE78_08335 [Nitrososphaeria archaeon]
MSEYWFLNLPKDLSKISYGDNPGLFIFARILHLSSSFDSKCLSLLIGGVMALLIFITFRLFILKYILKNSLQKDLPMVNTVSSVISMSYFLLSIPFMVNFQYAPQSFALTMLILLYMFIYYESNIKTSHLMVFNLIYSTLIILHPFIFMFVATTLIIFYLMLSLSKKLNIFKKLKIRASSSVILLAKRPLILFSIVTPTIYVFYQSFLLRISFSQAILRLFSRIQFEESLKYYEQLISPSYPQYAQTYLVITYVHNLGLIILTIYLIFLSLSGIKRETCKVSEISIILTAALLAPIFAITSSGLETRIQQILLIGLLLLVIHGLYIINKRHLVGPKVLLVFLIILAFLATVKYTWYSQPPYLSYNDAIISKSLFSIIDWNNFDKKILSHSSLSVYFNNKYVGNTFGPFISTAFANASDIQKTQILWSTIFELECIKYRIPLPKMSELLSNRNLLFDCCYIKLLY